MPIKARQFTERAQRRLAEVHQTLAQLESSFTKHDEQMAALRAARAKLLEEMATLNLPRLGMAEFEACRDRTGYGQFVASNPIARMNQEHVQLQRVIAEIDADERYVRREELIDPVAGELTHRAMRMKEDCELMREAVKRYEALPRFIKLIDNGYGTEAYSLRPWHLDFYRDWKYGDKVCEALGKERFADVRAEYMPLRQGLEQALAELRRAEKEIMDIRKLVELRQQSAYRLENLPALILSECQQALKEHLEYVDREQLHNWAQGDREREAMVKKLHGIEKKIEYLEQMKARQYQAEKEALATYAAKLQKKIVKYSSPKNARAFLRDQDANAWLADPRQRLYQRRERFWQGYDRIVVFEHYDRYDYAQDILWWDLMTDGRVDGDFIPEVRDFRGRHPVFNKKDYRSAGASSTGRKESLMEVS